MKEDLGKIVKIINRKGSEYKVGVIFFAIFALAIAVINILARFGFSNEMINLIMSTSTFVVAFFVFYMTVSMSVENRKESRQMHVCEREEDKQIRTQERKEIIDFFKIKKAIRLQIT